VEAVTYCNSYSKCKVRSSYVHTSFHFQGHRKLGKTSSKIEAGEFQLYIIPCYTDIDFDTE